MEHKYWYIWARKFTFNVAARSDSVFINTTIYNYLWNSSSLLIERTKNLLPSMVPTENMGVLAHVSVVKVATFPKNVSNFNFFSRFMMAIMTE